MPKPNRVTIREFNRTEVLNKAQEFIDIGVIKVQRFSHAVKNIISSADAKPAERSGDVAKIVNWQYENLNTGNAYIKVGEIFRDIALAATTDEEFNAHMWHAFSETVMDIGHSSSIETDTPENVSNRTIDLMKMKFFSVFSPNVIHLGHKESTDG